jgi:tRNA uridine 5-carboxymethylaminomethyl modification enzyme
LKCSGREAWWPRRDEAYLGVLIDDLITRGTSEPYRMFTSRAEFRLLLREDNADLRLTPKGRELGLVDDERWSFFETKRTNLESELKRLAQTNVHPDRVDAAASIEIFGGELGRDARAFELLRRPEVNYNGLVSLPVVGVAPWWADADERIREQVALETEVQAKYLGYIERQSEEIARHRRHEDTRLPPTLDYQTVRGLSTEVRQRLVESRPATLGQASRIPGMTPAAISLLLVHLKKTSIASSSIEHISPVAAGAG